MKFSRIRQSLPRPYFFLLVFAAVNLLWRFLFLPVNQGTYTDGILQIDMFRLGVSFWPPLYALLARLFVWLPWVGLEGAGRLVSLICGVLVLWPLLAIARRLFGLRAACWAMAAWTVTPLALQSSLQVMTDMPFTLFWLMALAGALLALECALPGLFPQVETAPASADPAKGAQWLIIAAVCGALATLTRYQGILLLPPLALLAWVMARAGRGFPGRRGLSPWLALLPWLAVPAWLVQGMSSIRAHFAQIGERTGNGLGSTLVNYWNLFEEFTLKSPYFLGYGLFGFLLYGLFRTQWATARLRWTGWLSLYLALAVVAMQSAFSSYQARYLLPLAPLACLFAGHGMAVWERHNEKRPARLWGLILPALGWGMVFSALVAVYQGNPFKDLKDGARYVRGLNLPPAARVLSNEFYNPEQNLFDVKVGFWVGRPVQYLGYTDAKPGDVIVFSSYFCGMETYYKMLDALRRPPYSARKLKSFSRFALPLITDIMQEPGTAQSPLAWCGRYQWQFFETTVLQVQGSAARVPAPAATPAPMPANPLDKKMEEIKSLRGQIEQLRTLVNNQATTR